MTSIATSLTIATLNSAASYGVVSAIGKDAFAASSFGASSLLQTDAASRGALDVSGQTTGLQDLIAALPAGNEKLLKDLDTILALSAMPVSSQNLFSPYSIDAALAIYKNPALSGHGSTSAGILSLLS